MTKRALCVGINAYPGMELSGCVNDAMGWADLLEAREHVFTILLDGDATRLNILEELRAMVSASKFGDRIVFTYSGHGSWVPDLNGDEPDGRDEVLVPVDYVSGFPVLITDDELADVFALRRRGVRVTVISDSCHSGSVNRFIEPGPTVMGGRAGDLRRFYTDTIRKPRFMPPSAFLDGKELVRARAVEAQASSLAPRNTAGTVLMSGCADEEYSYDAYIDGRPQGAFSWAAITAHKALTGDRPPTYRKWHSQVRELLPSADYPQSPDMYASLWQRGWRL